MSIRNNVYEGPGARNQEKPGVEQRPEYSRFADHNERFERGRGGS